MNDQTTLSDKKLNRYFLWRLCRRSFRALRFTFMAVIGLVVLSGIVLLYLKSRPLPAPDIPVSTKIYDDAGQLIDRLDKGKYREPVKLKDVPTYLINATLAAEDETFYTHFGFSIKGILRAAWTNLQAMEIKQGASTITQQLARNLYLSHDRTISRKLKEAVYALQLELHYSKDEILEMYLNDIYYGNGAYGIKRAAKVYLDKELSKLSLAESAFLAGIPRGPSFYSPYQHFSRAKNRQQHILKLMVEDQMITAKQANMATQATITIVPPAKPTKVHANYFRDFIIQSAIKQYGLDEPTIEHGGLKIYTSLNTRMQKAAEQSLAKQLQNKGSIQGALISVDPHTGQIKAMVGGKSYEESPFNRVFAKRQPGSSFKPILYLSALEHGFMPTTSVVSQPTAFRFNEEIYRPQNFQNQYTYQPILLREAIARSDNIYAVSAGLQVGLRNVIDMAHRLGITSPLHETPSLALGSYTVTPYEMAQVYATIASGGLKRDLTGIVKIVDADGQVIANNRPKAKQVALTSHTYVLTHLLQSVLRPGGTAHRVGMMFDHPAAGKTGSTDWDGWISGYTPDLVTTVWVGHDRGKKLAHYETRLAQYIWARYMNEAAIGSKKKPFPVPKGVTGVYIDPATGYLATPLCKHARLEYFVSGTEPKQSCPLHPQPKEQHKSDSSWWRQFWNWWEEKAE